MPSSNISSYPEGLGGGNAFSPEEFFKGAINRGMSPAYGGSAQGLPPGIEPGSAVGGIMGLLNYFSPQARDNRLMQSQMQGGLNEYLRRGAAPAADASGGYNPALRSAYPQQTQLAQNPMIQDYVQGNESRGLAMQNAQDLQNYATAHGVPSALAPEQYRGTVEQGLEADRLKNTQSLEQQREQADAEREILGEGARQNYEDTADRSREEQEILREGGQQNREDTQNKALAERAQSEALQRFLEGPAGFQMQANNPKQYQQLLQRAYPNEADLLAPPAPTGPQSVADVNALDKTPQAAKPTSRLEYDIAHLFSGNGEAPGMPLSEIDPRMRNGTVPILSQLRDAYDWAQAPVDQNGQLLPQTPAPLGGAAGQAPSAGGIAPLVQGNAVNEGPMQALQVAQQKLQQDPSGRTLTQMERDAIFRVNKLIQERDAAQGRASR